MLRDRFGRGGIIQSRRNRSWREPDPLGDGFESHNTVILRGFHTQETALNHAFEMRAMAFSWIIPNLV
jgi:hypothetical protein